VKEKDLHQIEVNEFSTVPSGTVHDMQESPDFNQSGRSLSQRLSATMSFSALADAWIFIWRHSKWQQTSN
jgi:hypothetical protein